MTYEEALAYITSLAPRGWRLGLDRMSAFIEAADLTASIGPPTKFVHVTGTNGKGSVTAYLQSLMVESGYRAGAFFSPFVYDPRERIQFGRDYIAKKDLARLTSELMPIAEGFSSTEFGGITEFEFKTALGFAYWQDKACDWVALEVGLGGRLDSTNVVSPAACVIVSISLDHTSILGSTPAEIATEKAGIIKPGVPVVVGRLPTEAMEVIENRCKALGCELWRLDHEVRLESGGRVVTPHRSHSDLTPGLFGMHQPDNMAIAVAAMDAAGGFVSSDAVSRGVAGARIPGRFERREVDGRPFILDGAHNAAAAESLAATLKVAYPGQKFVLITNMVQGHEPQEFYTPLAELIEGAYVVPIDFHRAQPPSMIAAELNRLGVKADAVGSIDEALEAASGSHVLVAGSFYLVGEVGSHIPSPCI